MSTENGNQEIPDDDALLSDEAKADAAPVAADAAYQWRKNWKPWGNGSIGYIVNNAGLPVAFLKWPKKKRSKE